MEERRDQPQWLALTSSPFGFLQKYWTVPHKSFNPSHFAIPLGRFGVLPTVNVPARKVPQPRRQALMRVKAVFQGPFSYPMSFFFCSMLLG